MSKTKAAWVRAWKFKRKGKKTVHVEVRDPKMNLYVTNIYRGKDHTLHIILKEGEASGTEIGSAG